MPPLASPESDIGDTSAEIPYWWRVRSTQIWDARELARRLGEGRRISFSLSAIFWLIFCYCLLHWLRASQVARTKYYNTTCIINQDNDNLGNKFHGCFPDDSATKVQSNPHPTLKCGQKSQQIPRYPSVCPQGLIHISKSHLKSIMFQRYFWLAYAHVNFLKW